MVEVVVPQIRGLAPGQRHLAFDVSPTHVGFDTYDVATQRLVSHHIWPRPDGRATTFESHHRYVWPSELDLMARLAGLDLKGRWADWSRGPFTSESTQHVSVWERPATET